MAATSTRLAQAFDAFIRRPVWWPLLLAFWALVVSASYAWHLHELENHAHAMAAQRGRLVFEMVEITRLWAAQHGGVYASVTEKTPPNPWLQVPEKTFSTPSGHLLTKINPAYMTRQLGDLIASEQHDMRIHLTSLKPINPNNGPDAWEREALTGFESRRAERISIVGADATAIFRYMAPLEVKKPCMACHEQQGYQVGDVRGGISVSFPAGYIYNIINAQKHDFLMIHVVAFALFALAASGSLWVIRRHVLALEATRNDLLESEKMASLGRMVAGFAHEVNTPIGVAVGATSHSQELVGEIDKLLGEEEVAEEDLRGRLALLDEAAGLTLANLRRASALVQSFKRTAVDQTSEAERDYDLAEVIEDVRKSLHSTFKNTPVRISTHCPDNLWLHGPVGALEQLLTNLFTNSRLHAFADGTAAGTIAIRARQEHHRAIIEFSDDGAGMTADTLAHAFEPFFTTRRGAGGSGLGLYLVYTLVTRKLHGRIACESQPGAGTRFTIDLPLNAAMAAKEP